MNVCESDALEAFSLPVFMLQDAADSIREVKIGEEHKKQKERELIFMILGIVFTVLPFAGSGVGGGAARLAGVVALAGEACNLGLAIAESVHDSEFALFHIITALLGAGGVRVKDPRAAFRAAAVARQGLGPEKLKLFSPAFRRKDEIIQKLIKRCP